MLSQEDIKDAEERLERFAAYIEKVFPETSDNKGIIESPLLRIPKMKDGLEKMFNQELTGDLLLKCDNHLAYIRLHKSKRWHLRDFKTCRGTSV